MVDPRLQNVAATANEIIVDKSIRHSIFLERLKTQEVNEILKLLNNKVLPDLVDKFSSRLRRIGARGFDTGPATSRAVKRMIAAVNAEISSGTKVLANALKPNLLDIAKSEVSWLSRTIQAATPVTLDITTPSISLLRTIVTERPMQGRLLADWWKSVGRVTRQNVTQQLQLGLVEGESVGKIIRRLTGTRSAGFTDGVLNIKRRHVESIVRTSVNHVTTQAREILAQENQDIIKGMKWIATLDTRTTEICISLDGRVFPVGKGPRPPAHVRCRSGTAPVTKSWKEMGINLKEAPKGTRASMNGQVPADLTYGKWLKKQPINIQNEALGKGKAELFRRGKVPVTKFVDNKLRPLTLSELEALEMRLN